MDPNFGIWLNTRHTEPFRDDLERELVTYRTAADRPSRRLIVASRHHRAKLFLAFGNRLTVGDSLSIGHT